jgi:nitronate monooxygenase
VWPGAFSRAWRNDLIRRWWGREWEIRHRRAEIAAEVAKARAAGDAQGVPLLFGQDAGLVHSIEPAGELVARIVREAEAVIAANARLRKAAEAGAASRRL